MRSVRTGTGIELELLFFVRWQPLQPVLSSVSSPRRLSDFPRRQRWPVGSGVPAGSARSATDDRGGATGGGDDLDQAGVRRDAAASEAGEDRIAVAGDPDGKEVSGPPGQIVGRSGLSVDRPDAPVVVRRVLRDEASPVG